MSDSGVRWGPPPSATNGPNQSVWVEYLTPVMERPGQWAFVRTMKENSARTIVYRLRNREDIIYPPGKWQFEVRMQAGSSDLADIYAKYKGPE